VIRNIISDSGDADVKGLQMTYVFELDYPHIAEGSEEEAQEVKKMKGVSSAPVLLVESQGLTVTG
jgi:hypothetical protein